MTNVERIIETLRASASPMTDRELSDATAIASVQSVNQACRTLARRGVIRREAGGAGLITNVLHQGWESIPSRAATSSEQQQAEALMVETLSRHVGAVPNPAVLTSPSGASVNVDAVSADRSVLAECWAHQGPAKTAQKWKLVNDAVKLSWVAGWLDSPPSRSILCVSDERAVAHLRGRSWQRQAIETLGVELEVVSVSDETVSAITAAQVRQGHVDAYTRRTTG